MAAPFNDENVADYGSGPSCLGQGAQAVANSDQPKDQFGKVAEPGIHHAAPGHTDPAGQLLGRSADPSRGHDQAEHGKPKKKQFVLPRRDVVEGE
jgi:hypothetical protein